MLLHEKFLQNRTFLQKPKFSLKSYIFRTFLIKSEIFRKIPLKIFENCFSKWQIWEKSIILFIFFSFLDAQLPCFKNGCSGTVQNLRKRFHMNLTEQEMERKVEQLVQDSLKSLSTKLYDGYQYYTNGILWERFFMKI